MHRARVSLRAATAVDIEVVFVISVLFLSGVSAEPCCERRERYSDAMSIGKSRCRNIPEQECVVRSQRRPWSPSSMKCQPGYTSGAT